MDFVFTRYDAGSLERIQKEGYEICKLGYVRLCDEGLKMTRGY